jgi:hypothetical protein
MELEPTRSYVSIHQLHESIAPSQQGHVPDIAEAETFRVVEAVTAEAAERAVDAMVL